MGWEDNRKSGITLAVCHRLIRCLYGLFADGLKA